jgi:hypothetical protein
MGADEEIARIAKIAEIENSKAECTHGVDLMRSATLGFYCRSAALRLF